MHSTQITKRSKLLKLREIGLILGFSFIPFYHLAQLETEFERKALFVNFCAWSMAIHKHPVITATTSTGCGYRLVRFGIGYLRPVLAEGFAQTRSRSKSVAIETS